MKNLCFLPNMSLKFRKEEITISTDYLYANLPPAEREVLERFSRRERKYYIAAKYMFKTPAMLAKNLELSYVDATKRLKLIQKGQTKL